jgi:hypothetical protein
MSYASGGWDWGTKGKPSLHSVLPPVPLTCEDEEVDWLGRAPHTVGLVRRARGLGRVPWNLPLATETRNLTARNSTPIPPVSRTANSPPNRTSFTNPTGGTTRGRDHVSRGQRFRIGFGRLSPRHRHDTCPTDATRDPRPTDATRDRYSTRGLGRTSVRPPPPPHRTRSGRGGPQGTRLPRLAPPSRRRLG